MNDPILLLLAVDAVVLILLGVCGAALPVAATALAATVLSGFGALLCLLALLPTAPVAAALHLPVGPPGLSLELALDPLSLGFLAVVLLAGTAVTAFQAAASDAMPLRRTACCVGGSVLTLLAADGVALGIGLAVACGGVWLTRRTNGRTNRNSGGGTAGLLVPSLLVAAVCLLTPVGFAPWFNAIRAAPVDPNHVTAAAVLTIAAFVALVWAAPHGGRGGGCSALTPGVLIPLGIYLQLRLLGDLAGGVAEARCGFVLLLGGAAAAVIEAWCSARHSDIDGSAACLVRRQAALATAAVGLALVARAADLPEANAFALAATFLSVVGVSVAGVLASLASYTLGASAGTYRLSNLGGLARMMPGTAGALAAGVLGLSVLPPGVGFAAMWLLFQSVLLAPRSGGLLTQVPLALTAAALAGSAALATTAGVRLLGIALLGRPRAPLGAGVQERRAAFRTVLLGMAGVSMAVGVLPGPVIWFLAEPAIRLLSGAAAGTRIGLALLLPSLSSPSYLPLPVLALLGLATGVAFLAPRRLRTDSKVGGVWADGMAPSSGLPFGDPAAQSAGAGFLPALPATGITWPERLSAVPMPRPISATGGLWLLLVMFGVLLLVLAVAG